MATDDQWRLVEEFWDQQANSACTLELRDRIAALEANMKGIAWAFDQHAAKWQQDEDVERVAGDPQPIATNEEILRVYWAGGNSSDARLRCVYDLGRQHGAAANSKPTPNDGQIRSSAPAVGLVEGLGSVPDVWSAGKPLHPAARRAAIHHIADWLELQQEVPIGSTASADYFAAMLRSEAGR